MQIIPEHYWSQNYPKEYQPSFRQRWWVQRWLELTDPRTSYWQSMPLTNTPLLLQELTEWIPYQGTTFRGRTLFFLLSELLATAKTDETLKRCLTYSEWRRLQKEVGEIIVFLRTFYNRIGANDKKPNKEEKVEIQRRYWSVCEDPRSPLSHHNRSKRLLNASLQKLNEDRHYLHAHLDPLKQALSNESGDPFDYLDRLTQTLLVELVARHGYALSYLKQRCLTTFLRPNSGLTFEDRLEVFLDTLVTAPLKFNVYMRVQARQIVREIGRIGDVSFVDAVPEMARLAEDMRQQGLFDAAEEEHAKRFFYKGQPNERQVFAVVSDIEAEDCGKAVIKALRHLDRAIRQAKFEFELGEFSIDNRMYVYNTVKEELTYFTKRQAQRAQYGALGKPLNLERLLFALSEAEANPSVPPELVEKVSSFALHWHRAGLEATALESKFLNHWFGLEQIFTVIPGIVQGKRRASDKLVLALAQALVHHGRRQPWLDLWGDLVRCGFFGPSPLLTSYDGIVWFNEPLREIKSQLPRSEERILLTDNAYYDHVQCGSPRPKITIEDHSGVRQTLSIKPGMLLYVNDTDRVKAGHWIGGAWLGGNAENIALQKLFYGQYPNIRNVWYLIANLQFQRDALSESIGYSGCEKLLHYLLDEEIHIAERLRDHPNIRRLTEQLMLDDFRSLDHSRILETLDAFGTLERLILDIAVSRIATSVLPESIYEFPSRLKTDAVVTFLEELDTIRDNTINEIRGSLPARIHQLFKKRDSLEQFLPLYVMLREGGRTFIENHTDTQEWIIRLPASLLRELYRGQRPDIDVFTRVVHEHPRELARLCEGQPLLCQRIMAYSKEPPTVSSCEYYLWQTDRMRRARNALVHEAEPYENLEMLTRQLHQYSRIYLRKVIGRMADAEKTIGDEHIKWLLCL
jgi:hypothetical protein